MQPSIKATADRSLQDPEQGTAALNKPADPQHGHLLTSVCGDPDEHGAGRAGRP